MNVKIDTKEKFTVITPEEATLSVNMTEELCRLLVAYMQKDIPHIILNLKEVKTIEGKVGEALTLVQQQFYENNCSFVICEIQKPVEELLDNQELLELMNVTPSESEAWDIVQMEEIERELLGDDEPEI
jgi:anti-anti-sigma regulatory factor